METVKETMANGDIVITRKFKVNVLEENVMPYYSIIEHASNKLIGITIQPTIDTMFIKRIWIDMGLLYMDLNSDPGATCSIGTPENSIDTTKLLEKRNISGINVLYIDVDEISRTKKLVPDVSFSYIES